MTTWNPEAVFPGRVHVPPLLESVNETTFAEADDVAAQLLNPVPS